MCCIEERKLRGQCAKGFFGFSGKANQAKEKAKAFHLEIRRKGNDGTDFWKAGGAIRNM
jgi:hypothetical protein